MHCVDIEGDIFIISSLHEIAAHQGHLSILAEFTLLSCGLLGEIIDMLADVSVELFKFFVWNTRFMDGLFS